MKKDIYEQSLDYHRAKPYGKIAIIPTKPLTNPHDLALAYSPGVAKPCLEIEKDPLNAFEYTNKGNLIGVISNGSAVLGLGNIGALAAKPVMEGKSILFKKFAGLDSYDIEINENDPDKLIQIIKSLEPTFGGINLEDIKAPECFYIEKQLSESLNIPVFHDDQHGTAIIVAAALKNALELQNKKIEKIKLVSCGAGAAAIACLEFLLKIGLKKENITVYDKFGVLYKGRTEDMDHSKSHFAIDTKYRSLKEIIKDADVFLGLSAGNLLDDEMILSMNKKPIIFALANPEPEVLPDKVNALRNDAIIATGRSDFANQVNNVICFPYIFKGALDVRATKITFNMQVACMQAIADLAKAQSSDIVTDAYGSLYTFSKDYIIPKPFDKRLFVELSYAVAKAAVEEGVARKQIDDWDKYHKELSDGIYRSGFAMRPIFERAKIKHQQNNIRLIFSQGENESVMQACQTIIDEKIATPILIGRPDVIYTRAKRLGLNFCNNIEGENGISIINPLDDRRYKQYWSAYQEIMSRKGVTPEIAKELMRTNNSIIAATSVLLNEADTMICGPQGNYQDHLNVILDVIGLKQETHQAASLTALALENVTLERGLLFISDAYANINPNDQELAQIAIMAANQVKELGIVPKLALISHSSFGSYNDKSSNKMQNVFNILKKLDLDFEYEGEMTPDLAIDALSREKILSNSKVNGAANVWIMPNMEVAHITLSALKTIANGQVIGPVLMGINKSCHICNTSSKVRTIVNTAAIAVQAT